MLLLKRVVIPISNRCNLHCKYCYRNNEFRPPIPDLSDDMKVYLQQLKSDRTECVAVTGGEPLLEFDKVKEIFSYVPKDVHKKITSNGLLLTKEIVDYINDNNIELTISHDGDVTQFLRGIDVLVNEKLVDLIKQVKILRIAGVVTRFNTNIWKNFFDTAKRLKTTDLYYSPIIVMDFPYNSYLIENFNYEEWYRTYNEFTLSHYHKHFPWEKGRTLTNFPKRPTRRVFFNILPNGTVIGMAYQDIVFGTIFDDYDTCRKREIDSGIFDYCYKTNCKYKENCKYTSVPTSKHLCKCRRMLQDTTDEQKKAIRLYLRDHLKEIEQKYNVVS